MQEGFFDGGKMGRRLQFLCVDEDSKAQTLCASDVVIFMGDDRGLGSSCRSAFHYLIIAIPLIWKKIDFRADSIAYIYFFIIFLLLIFNIVDFFLSFQS